MSEIWPLDVKNKLNSSTQEPIRPFKCLLLMPFEKRFDVIADTIKNIVEKILESLHMRHPEIKRLDWVTSSGVIQNEIWREIIEADLIFCDITGYNPNVMFECGVCSAWKEMHKVVFIKDHYFKQESAFDLSPIRYTEYELTSDGLNLFIHKVAKLTQDAVISFPDSQIEAPSVQLPFEKDYSDGHDDMRIFTPPYAHRRLINDSLEFGSLYSFADSWASIGKEKFLNFSLEFSARFVNPKKDISWIGAGLRSQNYFANYAHVLYLRRNGQIVITEPNEEEPNSYSDIVLRDTTPIDDEAYHSFRVVFDKSILSIQIDDFSHSFQVGLMKKVFGPGLIRFQSSTSWMAIKRLKILGL